MSIDPGMARPTFEPPQTSRMAVASLVLGVCSFLCFIVTGIPAVILGIIALTKINASRGRLTGGGFAIAGIITGALACLAVVPVALLLPAVSAARDAARRNVSINHMKGISLAQQLHHDEKRAFPAPGGGPGAKSQLSWRVHILPYLEQAALYERFHLDEPWDSEHNRALIQFMPEEFKNPSVDLPEGKTNYLLVTGPGTAFETDASTPMLRDFIDGTSKTIVLVEADEDQAVEWTKPEDWRFDPNNPMRGLGKLRQYGFLAAFGDIHTEFIGDDTDPEAIKAMMTPAGREKIPAEMQFQR